MTSWYIGLILGAVVIVVVAVLLSWILTEAGRIRAGASAIWTSGQRVAGQTVHIASLAQVNHRLRAIAGKAPVLNAVLQDIARHAADCKGCPRCITGDEA
ncbi:MAG: hypothetical protein ABIP94_11960 [Planctomycetota bacterium]